MGQASQKLPQGRELITIRSFDIKSTPEFYYFQSTATQYDAKLYPG